MLFRSATSRNIFAVAASGVVTTIAASAVLFSMAYSNVQTTSFEQLRGIAGSTAMSIEKSVAEATKSVVMMETSLATMKESGIVSREGVDAFLKHALRDNPTLLGTWSVWEPNALDGRDAEFANTAGHDASGRFIPYWTRDGESFNRSALEGFDQPGPGDSYLIPRQTRKISVIEPYNYVVGGKQVIMTSISAPILEDGEFLGVVGLDLGLDDVRIALSEMKPMGTGFVGLVTQSGNILSHPDSSVVGKPLKDAGDAVKGWTDLIAKPGVEHETVRADGETHLSIAVPVKITDDQSWYAIVSVPTSTVFSSLNSMAWSAAVVTLIAAVLLGLCGWLISRRFVARINNVIDETDRIASGKLDVELEDIEAKDEIGHLARSLSVLLENNRQKVQLEQQAEASRAAQEAERAERARIASAQEEEVKFAVGELASGLARLANGDMTVRLERAFTSSLDEIRHDFNDAVEKLQGAMLAFSDNAATIMAGSEEMRSAAEDLSHRTQQQAASVEETAAALEQITTSVKDSTVRAEEAGNLVARTKAGAERSGEVVRDAIEAMSAIEHSSQSISNIIGVIDEIAFQTNLLALNAGVEAARAGDAGKGFAVVAQEVRELAQRSAQAAKEIKNLITSSNEQVKRGVTLVDQTGEALQAIVTEVQEINRNVQAIVQSAREQSTGLQEINTAVNQMDQSTQKNAAMVEETNAAFNTLAQEVSSLSARLAQFNLGTAAGSSAAFSAPARASVAKPATPVAASPATHTPRPSPARALTGKLASAFGGGAAAAAVAPVEGDWEEF